MSGKIRRSAATIPVPAEAEKNTNTAAENRSGEEPQEKGDAEGNFYIAVNLIDRCPAAGDGASVRIPVTLSIQRLLIPAGLFPRHAEAVFLAETGETAGYCSSISAAFSR